MNRKRTQSFRISPAMMPSDDEKSTGSRPKSSRSSLSSTDVVDFSGGRRISELKIKLGMEVSEIDVSFSDDAGAEPPVDHFVEIVVATRENTKNVGWFITDGEDAIEDKVEIPFYSNVTEGGNFDDADWKDQAVVRSAKISWRDDSEIAWMERHLEMTQGFILIGKNPGLMILGEPTHDREDLSENERHFPDISRMKGYLVPAGCGIIIKKGTWHDFPVSVGPDITVFIINTAEVVEALMSMKEPAPMDFGDCYKIRNADKFQNVTLRFPDPRPMAKALGWLSNDTSDISKRYQKKVSFTSIGSRPKYGEGMVRVETGKWGGHSPNHVWVVPVINVEAFDQKEFGPSVQPHLNKTQPEIANSGWRDYGNKKGLSRLGKMFSEHSIACTAVVSSDLVQDDSVISQLNRLKQDSGWEIGAHGTNNSNGGLAGLTIKEEESAISNCIKPLEAALGCGKKMTWLTPGFSVTNSTPKLLLDAGVGTLLDFVDDDEPFLLTHENAALDSSLVCLPYSMETNDISLILTRNLSPREYAAAVESHILQLAKESRESGVPTVVCLGMHTFVAGAPAVVHELDKMLTKLQHVGNITWATAQQVSNAVVGGKDPAKISSIVNGTNHLLLAPAFESERAIQEIKCLNDLNSNIITIPAEPSPLQVDCSRLGLILIDFQNDFMSPDGFGQKLGNDVTKLDHSIAPTSNVLTAARSAGLTVIHTRECHRSNLADLTTLKAAGCSSIGKENGGGRIMVRGEWGSKFIHELKPLEDETVIDKPGKGSFYQTDLDLVLRNANIDTMIVCGVTTEVCVHTTVREAADRGIKCIVLDDCTASYFDEFHEVGIKMISAQGGIFGSVSNSKAVIDALSERERNTRTKR